ncbi:DNA-3-methyladenine glycosylase [Legionella wadsworthii]|uniref:DNA-3-methyladenine glycosylase II n=1 Tax=Legionella wadsworthii TaxID=28088 RepID=A0A378LNJ7_9GAMM|nr:DNA-3-methyladenine glycosylase [Legionella wadsworthii]STY28555.1 DNA-3-methyladenine glycosylase [Legionella wadsworthii]
MEYSFNLHPIAPFRLDYTVSALRRRSKNNVDLWDGQRYTRVLILENIPVKVVVEQIKGHQNPELLLMISHQQERMQYQVASQIEKILGLKKDLGDFYSLTDSTPIYPLVIQFKGVKPPRFPSVFEALVNAISCQQISLDAGLQMENRLVEYLSLRAKEKDRIIYAFPRPEEVANCSISDLKKLGYSARKSETLIHLATTILENTSVFEALENKSNEEVVHFLTQFKGIGRWTAEYVLLRGLGRIDVFPGDDVGAQNNLYKLLHLDKKPDYHQIAEITAKWHPYAGLIYFHLLLKRLYE